jgi:hypothetical protein
MSSPAELFTNLGQWCWWPRSKWSKPSNPCCLFCVNNSPETMSGNRADGSHGDLLVDVSPASVEVNSLAMWQRHESQLFSWSYFHDGAEEMAQWLGALVVLTEDWCSIPSPRMVTHDYLWLSSRTSEDSRHAHSAQTHMSAKHHTHQTNKQTNT